MKVKLLKKVRKKISLWERNGIYYLFKNGKEIDNWISKSKALKTYRKMLIWEAQDIFGIKMKRKL